MYNTTLTYFGYYSQEKVKKQSVFRVFNVMHSILQFQEKNGTCWAIEILSTQDVAFIL